MAGLRNIQLYTAPLMLIVSDSIESRIESISRIFDTGLEFLATFDA